MAIRPFTTGEINSPAIFVTGATGGGAGTCREKCARVGGEARGGGAGSGAHEGRGGAGEGGGNGGAGGGAS
eukprot:295609-Prorocentrum_minimum.AAC.1